MKYKGTRWYKCDLHLHTTSSKCFRDQNVTPQQWVDRAIEAGLDCVAVTDHNTGDLIDEIIIASENTSLTVFPGVEITCDSSKIHLLILFDVTKSSDDIRDFLVRADIKRNDFGEQNAFTSKSIFQVAELANSDGALVIPAHIDEYNGLGSVSADNLKKFFQLEFITSVQVVHKSFLDPELNNKNYRVLIEPLNEYYTPTPSIDIATIKKWHTPVRFALEYDLAILTFSDNPHEPKDSKHGLRGIGSRYTWIKMDQNPSLEGLRQAFLLPEYRVRNDFHSPENPYDLPELWIRSIEISNTTITDNQQTLKIDFNPQLNTIIGGRGSGKSSILRFIRGVFNRTNDISNLDEIFKDHYEFYKIEEGKAKKGVLGSDSEIKIEFIRENIPHIIKASNINNSTNQQIEIYRQNNQAELELIESEGYIDFFEFEQYSQKQIYEIAQEPNSLRERIDASIEGLDSLIADKENIKSSFLAKSSSIRDIKNRISGKGKLLTEIKDLEDKIGLLQESGIANLIRNKEKFYRETTKIRSFTNQFENREAQLEEIIQNFEIEDIDLSDFDSQHSEELTTISNSTVARVNDLQLRLKAINDELSQLRSDFNRQVQNTIWKSDSDENLSEFEEKKLELEVKGIDSISSFENLSQLKSQKTNELDSILELEERLAKELEERAQLQIDYLNKSKQITQKRSDFLSSIVDDDKIQIKIHPFRNQKDFEQKLRRIIQRDDKYEDDIEFLKRICFEGNVENKITEFRNIFSKILNNESISVSGWFVNLVKRLNPAQIDELEIMLPEDEIEVKYRPTQNSPFKALSVASAGQKTTAILTFILSFGNNPLILDQPEDDLDNRLVYDLIVDRLKIAKEKRQIIVVTHNANIPLNGDAEYIISMDSDSKNLNVIQTGTVEQPIIKKEICDVMEGSEQAFQMRSKRYEGISS